MIENNKQSKSKMFFITRITFVIAFCLMLLPFEHLYFIESAAFADSNDMISYSIGLEKGNDTVIHNSEIRKELLELNITTAIEEKDKAQKDNLLSLIEQLNSIQLSFSGSDYESEEIYNNVVEKENDNNFLQNVETQPKITNEKSENKYYEMITAQTIQKLKQIAEKPDEIDNPFEIGNTLYLSNNIGEAAAFYQEALRRKKPEDMSASEDRAWLLFQTGNSLRTIDMLAAADMYQKLITEYPDSPWASYAKVQRNVITWYVSDKPNELLEQNKR